MALTIRLARNLQSFDRFTHLHYIRRMSSKSFLIDQSRYAFLKDLGLESHN
ncbi:putative Aldehyde dehydrogenase 7 family, partial [Daphnia magna]